MRVPIRHMLRTSTNNISVLFFLFKCGHGLQHDSLLFLLSRVPPLMARLTRKKQVVSCLSLARSILPDVFLKSFVSSSCYLSHLSLSLPVSQYVVQCSFFSPYLAQFLQSHTLNRILGLLVRSADLVASATISLLRNVGSNMFFLLALFSFGRIDSGESTLLDYFQRTKHSRSSEAMRCFRWETECNFVLCCSIFNRIGSRII